jgi:hypothetical protein
MYVFLVYLCLSALMMITDCVIHPSPLCPPAPASGALVVFCHDSVGQAMLLNKFPTAEGELVHSTRKIPAGATELQVVGLFWAEPLLKFCQPADTVISVH